ncbi:MAG: DUF1289 domain-containing protein [Pseudomonadota bacterium]
MSQIQSPCILICSIDLATGYCYGCGRTSDEIAGWFGFTNEQRSEITQHLADRLARIERRPRRETRRRKLKRLQSAGLSGKQDP